MYCSKCGKYLPEGTRFCTACGAAVSQFSGSNAGTGTGIAFENQSYYNAPQQDPYYSQMNQYPAADDAPSTGFGVLSFFFPLVGLILYLVWKDQYPLKAKSAGKGALIGAIVCVVLVILFAVVMPIALITIAQSY